MPAGILDESTLFFIFFCGRGGGHTGWTYSPHGFVLLGEKITYGKKKRLIFFCETSTTAMSTNNFIMFSCILRCICSGCLQSAGCCLRVSLVTQQRGVCQQRKPLKYFKDYFEYKTWETPDKRRLCGLHSCELYLCYYPVIFSLLPTQLYEARCKVVRVGVNQLSPIEEKKLIIFNCRRT